MSLVNRKPQQPAFMNAREVAERFGGYSFKTVLNGDGPFKELSRRYAPNSNRPLFRTEEVDALIQKVNADHDAEQSDLTKRRNRAARAAERR